MTNHDQLSFTAVPDTIRAEVGGCSWTNVPRRLCDRPHWLNHALRTVKARERPKIRRSSQ
eukprot:5229533-Pleurochrysis_carterae.AAC.1